MYLFVQRRRDALINPQIKHLRAAVSLRVKVDSRVLTCYGPHALILDHSNLKLAKIFIRHELMFYNDFDTLIKCACLLARYYIYSKDPHLIILLIIMFFLYNIIYYFIYLNCIYILLLFCI